MTFLNFLEEASHVFLPDSRPPYIYGNHIIMDNATIHHNRAGDALGEWVDDISCSFVNVFPRNESKYVFDKLKTVMKRFEIRELLQENLHVRVHEALKEGMTDESDVCAFFKYTGYINI